ncbi:toprim domain-containing protein [Propioniciclava sp.]|uniref:toprim domain-containing protein n=1 Tax=Propioniciclava sp. TaxID=2038686 RepID=UPI0026171640|nr:toprim domain-containing protein [Propioniciclava sp.]
MDAIAVTLATNSKYIGVAPLGTSLTDEQAAQLSQLGHRTPIVATDGDLAGRVAAERDYWILSPYGHDPRHAPLPDGTDPADLLTTGRRGVLTAALDNARPLSQELIDERFAHLAPAHAAFEVLRIIAAQPPKHWETGLQDIAERLSLPVSVLRTALTDLTTAWNEDPRASGKVALRDIGDVKNRLVHQAENSVREHVAQSASGTAFQI